MSGDIAQDVCKSVRSLGLSAPRTRRIVDGVIHDLTNNGPEWVATRIKDLQSYYAGTGDFPGWVRKRTRHDGLLKPKGWMGNLVGSHTSTDTIITVLSTVRGAMVFDSPTPKQLLKWSTAVTAPPSPGRFQVPPLPGRGSLETSLVKKLSRVKAFGPDDIHGSRYPRGVEDGVIRRGRGLDMRGLYHAWKDSIMFAPSLAWSFQDQSGVRIPGISVAKSRPILNSLRKSAPDARRKPYGKKTGKPSRRLGDYPVGHISFLQEPFGKLRTVANPNRFVQWQLTPLGETLSDWINHQPGIYNLCQEEGIRWIQDCLQSGIHLTSADLSSASDTLDYVQVTTALKKAGPEMRKHLEYFEQVSSMPWYITSPEARSYMESDTVRWKQGQPLGLRPSFPILTITNWMAARQAVLMVDGREDHQNVPFAIVGDDIVIHSKYADAYRLNICKLGGLANVDKACASDVQAEFCSRLISKSRVLRLKARYLPDNPPQNILTYQGVVPSAHAPKWVERASKRVGSFSLVESGLIPGYHPDEPKSLRTKVLMHAVLSLSQGKATSVEKSFQSMWWAATEADPNGVLPQPHRGCKKLPKKDLHHASRTEKFEKFREWNPSVRLEELPILLGMVSKYYPNTWDQWMEDALNLLYREPRIRSEFPDIKWIECTHPDFLREVELASAREQRVDTVRTSFDHKSMSYQPEVSPLHALSRLDRKIQSLQKDIVQSEGSETAMIRSVSPDVDELIEVKGGNVEVTTYGKTSTSSTLKVPLEEVIPPPKVSRPAQPKTMSQDWRRYFESDMEETKDEDEFEL